MSRLTYSLILSFMLITIIAAQSTIEIGTFNIRFFPCNEDGEMMKKYNINMDYPPEGTATDTIALFQMLKELEIELLAVEEIVDPELFGAMAKRHLGQQFEFIYAPSNGWQKIGFLYDSSVLELAGQAQIYPEVALGDVDRLRAAFRGYFKMKTNGFDFHAIVVHLKASPRGLKQREQQWDLLSKILVDLPSASENDADIILLGDFNNVSQKGADEFLPTIRNLNYFWSSMDDSLLISSYWQPDRKKQQLEASNIDQIFISADAHVEYIAGSLRSGGICSDKIKSIEGAFPDYFLKISDHCPVIASFRPYPDND